MQSMFRFTPWSSENPVMDKAQFSKQRPVVDIPLLSKLKRKRTNSPEPSPGSPFAKKWKYSEVRPVVEIGRPECPVVDAPTNPTPPAHLVAPSVPHVKTTNGSVALSRRPELDAGANAEPVPESAPQQPSMQNTPCDMADPTTYSPLQQIIETHFDHEILLKHNELRLIDQELAKCQIALEQIRRCRLIPYPGTDALSTQLSQGVGPALQPRQGFTTPEQPAPWGVADGPYTRHYAKWLIPDPKFDSVPAASLSAGSRTGAAVAEGRATRASQAELPPASKSRSSRASAGSKLQALGDPSAPRIDPLLHRRSTDGKWVRLFCHHPDCRHSNFSNTQGFLNHCRIKHNQKFESHDQAAVECGVLVDVNELGVVVPNESTPQTPAAASHTNGPFVHPLIKSNPPKSKPLPPRPLKKEHTTPNPVRRDSSFVPSPQTPNLSALLQRSGASVDLNQLVDFARTKVELPDDTEDDDETEPTLSVQNTPKPTLKGDAQLQRGLPLSRQPARGGMAPASLAPNRNPTPPAGTLRGGNSSMHRSSNANSTSSSSASSERGGALESPTMEMSPHTLDSAPGLVTDHEDDDDEEDDNGSVAMRDVTDFGVDDVVVEDASDVERDARRKSSVDGDALCDAKGAGVGGSTK
ncbi:uncharacterized protein J3D65DRAFT_559326 [Phyllosticta citribraziliensis]|uniref:AHC1-like C2H2 zinc-finger domain-containing protein n=1 Tax=Phyllosticta citribraziliensis TaxID=989973 RepID=A0ABR1LAL2_9PEZI